MGKQKHQISVENLSKFLLYILSRRPDEFGLVPDINGFVKYKELLQAIHEEQGWSYVRQFHLNEVLMGKDRGLYHDEGKRIRVLERKWSLDLETPATAVPGLLFIAVRKKGHPMAMEKGLMSRNGIHLVLTPDKSMAERIGKRKEQKPIILEIMAGIAKSQGVMFYSFAGLFVCPQIPARFIVGPPVSKDILEKRRNPPTKKDNDKSKPSDFGPGTFSLEASRDPDLNRRTKGKQRKGWKEEARKMRKGKRR